MLRGQSFPGSVSVTSPKRSGRKPFRDVTKGVDKTLRRGERVAYVKKIWKRNIHRPFFSEMFSWNFLKIYIYSLSGAPNDRFLSNAFKCCFSLSGVL